MPWYAEAQTKLKVNLARNILLARMCQNADRADDLAELLMEKKTPKTRHTWERIRGLCNGTKPALSFVKLYWPDFLPLCLRILDGNARQGKR